MRSILLAAYALLFPVAGIASSEFVYLEGCSGVAIPASDLPKFDRPIPKEARQSIKINAVTFNVTYLDVAANNNIGFDDPSVGADRQATMAAVLTYLGNVVLDSGSCDVEVQVSETDGSGALASAGSFFSSTPNSFQPPVSLLHITTGTDPSGSIPDVRVTVDFGYTWNNDTGAPGVAEFDLYSVLLHEMTHGLGVSSFANTTGASSSSTTGLFTTYDNLLHRVSDGLKVWNSSAVFQISASDLAAGDGSLDFRGATANTQYPGGANPFVDTLNPFTAGSNISHFQTSGTPAGTVMVRSTPSGVQRRTYTFFEAHALQDLGYTINPTALPVELDYFTLE